MVVKLILLEDAGNSRHTMGRTEDDTVREALENAHMQATHRDLQLVRCTRADRALDKSDEQNLMAAHSVKVD
ncbi:hypothetical protein NDU88_003139 [Pleurodeles waltl]|uniref:Uncharacterized protein n=1 Tax=Pleurodeles waltl TaxID=8319 RepID=A0AAV7W3X3_PLEWA|nr:hypothetical protein NDU88_003139 [Pleurodeles waltl]